MNEEIMQKVDKKVLDIIESYQNEKIKTNRNFILLKKKILREEYGIDWNPITEERDITID